MVDSGGGSGGALLNSAMEHLVAMTELRDREQLDLALAASVSQLLHARLTGVYRVVKDMQRVEHWSTRGEIRMGGSLISDALWGDADGLPLVDEFPLRQDTCGDQTVMQVPTMPPKEAGWLTILPLSDDRLHPGVVEIETVDPLSLDDVRTMQGMLRVYENFLRLLDSSQRDSLTTLLNRQTFDATFLAASLPLLQGASDEGAERRRTVGDTWWLGMLDIDHFKRINDQFGHLIGDEVLVLVARIMQQTYRHYDRLFRFGGEEFVVMIRCPEECGALAAFERLRRKLEAYPFPQVGTVTVSIGVTEVRGSDTPSAAFSRADEAVYQAKHQGRNRVLSHRVLVEAGVIAAAHHEGDVELF